MDFNIDFFVSSVGSISNFYILLTLSIDPLIKWLNHNFLRDLCFFVSTMRLFQKFESSWCPEHENYWVDRIRALAVEKIILTVYYQCIEKSWRYLHFMHILRCRAFAFTFSEKLIGFWEKIQFFILSLKDNIILFAHLLIRTYDDPRMTHDEF